MYQSYCPNDTSPRVCSLDTLEYCLTVKLSPSIRIGTIAFHNLMLGELGRESLWRDERSFKSCGQQHFSTRIYWKPTADGFEIEPLSWRIIFSIILLLVSVLLLVKYITWNPRCYACESMHWIWSITEYKMAI